MSAAGDALGDSINSAIIALGTLPVPSQTIWRTIGNILISGTSGVYGSLIVTSSGNTLTLDGANGPITSTNVVTIIIPSTINGQLIQRTLTSPISLTLPSSTINQRICGINTTDGQATYAVNGLPNNGTTNAIEWFLYYLYDPASNQDMLGISKSPLHNVLPANYFYGSSATTLTPVASGETAWDAMIISSASAIINPSNCMCVCLGAAITASVGGGATSAGWFSGIAIQSGYVPTWEDRVPKVRSEIISTGLANAIGYGLTDTKIRKINPPATNTGDKLQIFYSGGTVASGSIGGTEIYCPVDGYYNMDYTDIFTATAEAGISINSSQRTTAIGSINSPNIYKIGEASSANIYCNAGMSKKFFPAGTIIRLHGDGISGAAYSQTFYATFNGFE